MLLFQNLAVYTLVVLVSLEHVKRRLLDRGARVRPLCPFPTTHLAGVFFRREERYNQVMCLIQRCRLLTHGARVMSLRRFPPAHPVILPVGSVSHFFGFVHAAGQLQYREGTRKQMQDIHARGTRANTTRSGRHAVSASTSRLANTKTEARYAQAGAEYAPTGRTCSAST